MSKLSGSGHSFIVGIDLGGTNIVAAAVRDDGQEHFALMSELTHPEEGADAVVARIVRMARLVIDRTTREAGCQSSDFVGVGIGSPGPLNRSTGVVLTTPNLGWRDFPLRDKVADGLSLPATLDNDANCATLGEWWRGAARGATDVVGLTIGTGIGGGLILGGKLYHGASDVAAELGHTTIDSTGRLCKCGNYGCLEAYASGSAIADRARETLEETPGSLVLELAGGDPARISAQTVFEASANNDMMARMVVRDTARFLGIGIANFLNIFNPEMVVVMGGVTHAGSALLEPLRAEVKRRAFPPAVAACRIVLGELTGTAGVVGAAATFMAQSSAQ